MRVDSGGDPGGNETRRVTVVTSGFSATLENDPQVRGQPHAVHHRAHRNGRSLCVNVSPSALPDGGMTGRALRVRRRQATLAHSAANPVNASG